MRKTLLTTLAGGSAAALAATLALAGAASGKSSSGITFRLVEKSVGFHYVDNPPQSTRGEIASLGDSFAIKSTLLSPSLKQSGQLLATCTVASGGRNFRSVCSGMFLLKGGTLALMTTAGMNNRVTHIAVVGGTGSYAGARGEVTSISRGENSPYTDDTVHLLP
jgi:hypothetical protein